MLNKKYKISGIGNKIIVVNNGKEYDYTNKVLPGLDISIIGNFNTIRIEMPNTFKESYINIDNSNYSVVNIKSNDKYNYSCWIKNNFKLSISWGNNQYFTCGHDFTCADVLFIIGEDNTGINIGNDCMVSANVVFFTCDGHAITDVNMSEVLNKAKCGINIGNHCWIGYNVNILKEVQIGNNCIIGNGTVLAKSFEKDNSIICGNPAKIIKEHINWSRDNISQNNNLDTGYSKKIAFLMPIYPAHYYDANHFIKTFKKHKLQEQADFYLVFTNEEDRDLFFHKKKQKDYIKPIVLSEKLRLFKTNGVINIKKLYGLSQIYKNYEYVIVIDNDTEIIKSINLYNMCKNYFNNKILYGTQNTKWISDGKGNVKEECFKLFKNPPIKYNEIQNNNLSIWFNQLCIYKSDNIEDFFEKTDMDNNIENLVFAQFDYYIYMYYLIMYHNFKIENIEVSVSAFLTDGEKEFFEPKSNKYKSINIYHSHPNIYKYFPNNENIFLFHQIDHFNKSYRKIFFKWKGVVVKKLRQFIACFVPSTKLRRKIRGQNK